MQPIQLVVFDMAGTTLTDHHEVERCFAQAATQTGLIVSEERILAMQGLSKRYVFETLWKEHLGEENPALKTRVDRSYQTFTEILEHHYLTHAITPTEGCLEAFDYLHTKGIAIALTTGFYRKVTNIILDRLGWLAGLNEQHVGTRDSQIQVSIASDEVERGRPYPNMIQKAMHLTEVTNPKAVVNIGDTPSDLLSGRSASVGLNIGVTNGTHSRAQLEAYPHDILLSSLRELPKLLSERAAGIVLVKE
ncbi:phosphonatase-like hydrolase [Nibrella saemangeumensis]|uniref:Phosphonatase-like hydrolase n=1 Tax=Nibrella saemangeumensis TaxID=1084526 RepID=A0ABP8MJI5_9BACT